MKKILSYIILISLLVSSSPGFGYAMEQVIPPLEREKDRTEAVLENLANRVDTTLERADNRISDSDQSEKIQEKQEEIQELLEEVRVSLEDAGNKAEVKEILEETKDIIVLKTSAALTPTEDITEDPSLQKLSLGEKTQAEETLLASLDSGERNTIMIRSRSREDIIREKLVKYDSALTMDFQFEEDGYKVYEVSVGKESLLSEELLENLDAGEVPESVLGIEIIRPELLQIGAIDFTGEDRIKLWGIEKYTTPLYLEALEQKNISLTRKVRIGIIDTGIESTHKDLVGQVNTSLGYDFVNEDSDPTDDQGHGTHVAGTIAGRVNGDGVFGVNPYVELVGLKICDNKGFCPSYSVLKALSYAKENNFDVLNMSLGARGNPETSPICSAVKDITAGGTIVVAAAGNSNVNTSTFVPGGCVSAITVAAVDESSKRAAFSNYGDKVDVAAPGVGVYSTYIGGGYKSLNGTSMATPHIVGLVSIIKMYRRDIRTDEVKTLFKGYTSPVISDTIKPVASGVDVAKLISNLAGLQGTQEPEKKAEPVVIKEEQKTEVTEKSNTGEVQKESTGSTEESIAIIDESIGLVIQNHDEKVEINSVSEGETITDESTVRINSDEGEEAPVTEGESESIGGNSGEEYSTETVEINSADSEVDFENLDLSGAISSDGVGEKAERTTIDIDPAYIPESDSVEINSDGEAEESSITLLEGEEESTGEDTGDTMIQNTYYCTMYVGGSCGYGLPAASIRQYQSTNSSIMSLSVGSNSFTLYGKQAGSSTLYVKYGSRILATVYVTVTQPVTPLRAYYGASSLMVGGSTYLTISSGNGGYSVTSSNSSVVSVSGYNTNWTLSARGAGTTTVSYRDSRGQYGSFTMTVTAPARDIRANIGTSSIETGRSTTLSITDGNGGYSVTSSNSSVASVSGGNTSWTITARTPGTTTLSIRDSRGKSLSITVTVLTPSKTLRYSYGTTSLQVGGSSMISILDGNGGYSVTSSNSSVASVSGGNTSWTIRGVAAGTATITLRDSRGKSATLTYTVLAPLRQVKGTLSSTAPRIGDTVIFTVTDGNGGYSVTSSSPSIISVVSGTDKNWNLRANALGQATITVSDSRGSRGSILVNVQSGSKPLTLSTYAITIEEGADAYFQVTSGNGGYAHSMSNSNVGWSYVNSSIPSYKVRGATPGTTILQIRDSSGKVAQVVVTVKELDYSDILSILESMDARWFSLIDEILRDILTSSVSEDGVEINASKDTFCELNNTGRMYYRPINASCVTNDRYNAWKCDSGYTPVGLNGGYSCVSSTYLSLRNSYPSISKAINLANSGTDKSIEKSRNTLISSSPAKKMTWLNTTIGETLRKYSQSEPQFTYNKQTIKLGILTEATDYKLNKLYSLYDVYKGELNTYKLNIELAILRNNYERIQVQKGYQIAKGNQDGYEQAVKDYLREIASTLDPREFVDLLLGIKNFAYNIDSELAALPGELTELKEIYLNRNEIFAGLDDYTRQYYTTYVETSVALELIPFKGGKLSKFKTSRSTSVMEKIKNIWKIKKVFTKGIKSIDPHVFTKHSFESTEVASKFLKGANIESVIKEGYGKTNKRFIETMSGTRPSILVEVDMGRIIGQSNTKDTNFLRIIVDYDGNIISSYPISNFTIN